MAAMTVAMLAMVVLVVFGTMPTWRRPADGRSHLSEVVIATIVQAAVIFLALLLFGGHK
jgi:lysylphosphatidylglycerol synthetase-like protein (DUF2156 family)